MVSLNQFNTTLSWKKILAPTSVSHLIHTTCFAWARWTILKCKSAHNVAGNASGFLLVLFSARVLCWIAQPIFSQIQSLWGQRGSWIAWSRVESLHTEKWRREGEQDSFLSEPRFRLQCHAINPRSQWDLALQK